LPVGRMFDPPGIIIFQDISLQESKPRHGPAYVQMKQNCSNENGD